MGHLAIQYSKAAGFETIALSHSKDKEELAYKLGADIVVRNGEELKNIGSSGGGGGEGCGGADVILATSNSYKTIGDSLNGLRPDGRIILMGVSTTEPLIYHQILYSDVVELLVLCKMTVNISMKH